MALDMDETHRRIEALEAALAELAQQVVELQAKPSEPVTDAPAGPVANVVLT